MLILCKDNANERNESLLSNCRVQLILCKDKTFISIKQENLGFFAFKNINVYYSLGKVEKYAHTWL